MKYYRVRLWGYGGEAAYIKLSEEAYNYWKPIYDEEGEESLMDYMLEGDSFLDEDTAPTTSVPEHADFMAWKSDEGERYQSAWYEAPDEFAHEWGVEINNGNITVEEVDSAEYMANHVADIIDGMTLQELHQSEEWGDAADELVEYGCLTDYKGEILEEPDYVCQFWSAEKGTFFDALIETEGEFDLSKLTIKTEEFPNGDDAVVDVMYDGESLDNNGGDTNGKGYSVYLWSNGA